MQRQHYIEDLRDRLAGIERQIARAEHEAQGAPTDERMQAIERLSALRIRHDELRDRIGKAEAADAEGWSNLRAGLQKDIDALHDSLERWMLRRS